ncbi:MAG: cation-transporting P-type ATPase, partial [Ruthenibacterium sp.]
MKKKNLKNNSIKNTETIMATNSKRLLDASMLDGEKLLSEYNTSWNGYNNNMVDIMREQYGENQITHQKNDSLFKRIICAFVNPFTAVLFVLAIISVITDVVIVAPADRDLT